jgi:hypothetical protein
MKIMLYFFLQLFLGLVCTGQYKGFYPPNTKWYQDPLGFRPLELSSAAGFAFGSVGVASTLLLSKANGEAQKFGYQEFGLSWGYKPPYSFLFQNNAGFLYQARKQMAIGLEWNLLHFKSMEDNTWNFGARPFARWYLTPGKTKRIFFEYGAGLSYSFNQFPLSGTGLGADTARTGTHFNFTTKYGIGAEMYLNKTLILQAGVRHFHLSNGNIRGVQRNPSHDSNGLFLGLLYKIENTRAKDTEF